MATKQVSVDPLEEGVTPPALNEHQRPAPTVPRPQSSQALAIEAIHSTRDALALQPKVKIRLSANKDPKAPNFVTVCVNGYLFQIRRGVEVEVPQTVHDVLVESQLY